MKVKIIDIRHSIIEKCKAAGFDATQGDYFDNAWKIPKHVVCSASNPHFTFGGGIDRDLLQLYPEECSVKRFKQGGNERIGQVIFTVTVDFKLASNEELVRQALIFAKNNTQDDETLCLCALGTGIGMLHEDRFVELLKEVFTR